MYDWAVIGGGIVGLATSYKLLLKKPGSSLLLIEKEAELASHQTGNNSGVIHCGIYYRPGSLKAKICRSGVDQLVRFCEQHGVAYELSGKLIVAASEDERPRLHDLLERGRQNGVPGLRLVGGDELREIEPHALGVEAIHSPATGIVSFRAVATKLAERIREMGATIQTSAELTGLRRRGDCWTLGTSAGVYRARFFVSCAGLHSDRVAALGNGATSLRIVPFRGEYYRLKEDRRHLVRSLIYPVPDPRFPFLGVHFTRRIDGDVEAGPNAVLALAREGYRRGDVSPADLAEMLRFSGFWRMARRYWSTGLDELGRSLSKAAFVRSLQKLVPSITEDDLEKGGAGVRAMALDGEGNILDDFVVSRVEAGIHVLNAPSPAATSALAIADHIVGIGP